MPRFLIPMVAATACGLAASCGSAGEAPALNPFGPRAESRPDAFLGKVEFSDGNALQGQIYLTRDARLKIYDGQLKRHRDVPLKAVVQIDCTVKKEWLEKEWRFKQNADDEKVYTGRSYPAREYVHTITLRDGRTIVGPLSAIVYVEGGGVSEPQKFLLHKRQKGEAGQTLDELIYVRRIDLNPDHLSAHEPGAATGKD